LVGGGWGVGGCGERREEAAGESDAGEATAPVAANGAVADESGNIEIGPGLTARVVKNGYGRAAVVGDYADTNVWLWLYDESAEDKHGKFIWESGETVF